MHHARPERAGACRRRDPEPDALGGDYWIRLEIQPRHDPQGTHIGFIAVQTEITSYKRQQDILGSISEFSRRLLKSDDLPVERNRLLETVGRAANASRAFAYKVDPPVPVGSPSRNWSVSQLFEWGDDESTLIDNPEQQDLDLHELGFGRWTTLFAEGTPVILNSRSAMTSEEMETLAALGIHAICLFPIITGERVSGLIGFDFRDETRAASFAGWSDLLVNALSASANVYASALERATGQATLRAAVDALDDGFLQLDAEERLILANRRYLELYPSIADAIVPGARFEDILRAGLAKGCYADAIGREEAWLKDRLTAFRSENPMITRLSNGTILRHIEQRTKEGGLGRFARRRD